MTGKKSQSAGGAADFDSCADCGDAHSDWRSAVRANIRPMHRVRNLPARPTALRRRLEKLSDASKQIPLPVSNAQANMFIVAPLTGEQMASLFMTHPPIKKRIERLMAMKYQKVKRERAKCKADRS